MTAPVAIISGGTRGIGRALALRLANRGTAVATLYHSDEQAASELSAEFSRIGATLHLRKCDVRDFDRLRGFARDVGAQFGRVDYLVNNVGIDVFKTIDSVSLEEWRLAQDVILNAPLVLTKEVLPVMRQRHFGRVVMLGASSRDYGKGAAGMGPFGVHKAALQALTRTLALEEIGHGVTVNMVSPGSTEGAGSLPEERRIPAASIPIGRRVSLGEVVDAIDYFLSDRAAGVTGQSLGVNGGLSM
jgi:3-oxoacyl-[acyl-carrier protein] reductase